MGARDVGARDGRHRWAGLARGAGSARLGGFIAAGALVAGCSAGSEPEPPPPAPVQIVTADVEQQLATDLQGERFYGWDRSTWQRARDAATSLQWQAVTAGGVAHAVACTGQGQPAVVYVNGWDAAAARTWPLAASDQARSTRVCMFDRPGNGLSAPRAGAAPHSTPQQHAQEMLALLAQLGEPGPYVLVPWSYGGLVARAAGTAHPDQIAGMVLIDAVSPLDSGLEEPWQGEDGIVNTDTIMASVGGGPKLGDRPVVVLEAGVVDTRASAARVKEWQQLQRQSATISDNSVHVVVDDATHVIPMQNPQAVVAATTAVVDSVRAGNAALPTCPAALVATGATCQTDPDPDPGPPGGGPAVSGR